MWLMVINFKAALLFKHLIYINIIILVPVLVLWNLSDCVGFDLAIEVVATTQLFSGDLSQTNSK